MLNFKPRKLSIYILKDFIIKLLLISLAFSVLFFIVDFLELMDDAKSVLENKEITILMPLKIAIYSLPTSVERVFQFVVLLASAFTILRFSSGREITIMRASGLSIWSVTNSMVITSFLVGVFYVAAFNPISSKLNAESQQLKNIYIDKEGGDFVESKNGIWFKQGNTTIKEGKLYDDGEILIRANKVYKDNLLFKDVILIYSDKDNNFIQRINVDKLYLKNNGFWEANNLYIIKEGEKTRYIEKMFIPTHLTKEFLINTIKNTYESVYNISFWQIKNSIRDFEASGLDAQKFHVRFQYLLSIPLLFAIMVYVAVFFVIKYDRFTKTSVNLGLSLSAGFIIYTIHNIFTQLATVERLSLFNAIWAPLIIFLLIFIILIIQKEELNN